MAITGEFNTDTNALKKRIHSHEQFGSTDINSWIFQNMELIKGISIVDLGCGTGKQTIPMSEIVGKDGSIFAIDISQEALNTLSLQAEQRGLSSRVNLLCSELDKANDYLVENTYDRVLSSFSLYYSQDPLEVIKIIWRSLKNNGIFFFCGPSKDNNAELKTFQNKIKRIDDSHLSGGVLFMEQIGQSLVEEVFGTMEIFYFENKLKFDSYEALYNYWSSYNLYDKEIENRFITETKIHFNNNSVFETTKRVLGIKTKK